ncbi:MAG: ADP-ribosylglycohydrolase family protein [Janthinobacterium lividum]
MSFQFPVFLSEEKYIERVYAGVLGKIIGVYLGRPFEQWSHERIERELGEVDYYVHEKLGQPLIVTDDDISGTFTFLRALAENGYDPDLTPAQIGDWWLNTIIENRTILWWGGFGLSTEHTAYLRLKSGHSAPESGSIALNGVPVAEEIGSQIFIDGWGLICPGDPARAVDFARRSASVSHDGEAIYGAQVVAALVALAFVETDLDQMLTAAQSLIPAGSLISALINDVRQWAAQNGDDWRATVKRIHEVYPYERFGTNCPMVSNHAIILLALLHGKGDFQRSLMIANTSGYDTDCNSGNVGCILGVLTGLAGIDAGRDWRGPVADRLYLPTADGGRAITDAVRETYAIVNAARVLAGLAALSPKDNARFHFSLPGSVQGFLADIAADIQGKVEVGNEGGRLSLAFSDLATVRVGTATFTPPDALTMGSYALVASPTLYPGQTITARVAAPPKLTGLIQAGSVQVGLYLKAYGPDDLLVIHRAPVQHLESGADSDLSWTVPEMGGQPVAEVGLELTSETPVSGRLLLDRLTWSGTPDVTLRKPEGGTVWNRAWVNGADEFSTNWSSPSMTYRVIQNKGIGLVSQGEASWDNYAVSVDARPHLASCIGLCAAMRGLRRYVALVLAAQPLTSDKSLQLIRQWDGTRSVLAEITLTPALTQAWNAEKLIRLSLTVSGDTITAQVGDQSVTVAGDGFPLAGAIGFLVEEGHAEFGDVSVRPAKPDC